MAHLTIHTQKKKKNKKTKQKRDGNELILDGLFMLYWIGAEIGAWA